MTAKRYGIHIYTYKGTDWYEWFESDRARDKAYDKAKRKVGMEMTRKTPYRIVKKLERR